VNSLKCTFYFCWTYALQVGSLDNAHYTPTGSERSDSVNGELDQSADDYALRVSMSTGGQCIQACIHSQNALHFVFLPPHHIISERVR